MAYHETDFIRHNWKASRGLNNEARTDSSEAALVTALQLGLNMLACRCREDTAMF